MSGEGKLVCVKGASGYIASWLVKLLLLRGYAVNATVRDPSDPKKVEHLLAFEGAKERLCLLKADLVEEGSFDPAINGCVGVFHTASPCFFDCQNPQAELLDPAIKGTINVLSSCTKVPSLKRVVLTSSLAAVVYNDKPKAPDVVVDESWFSDPEYCRKGKRWYGLSKTLAEETAWKYAKEKGIDLVSINPGFVLGPLLQPTLNESCFMILDLIKGGKTYGNIAYPVVNVKDVAKAHIHAFEMVSASGRYCLVESTTHFFESLKILREFYPTFQLPDKCENGGTPEPLYQVSIEKMKSLDIDFIPLKTSLKETIDSLKEKNFISF